MQWPYITICAWVQFWNITYNMYFIFVAFKRYSFFILFFVLQRRKLSIVVRQYDILKRWILVKIWPSLKSNLTFPLYNKWASRMWRMAYAIIIYWCSAKRSIYLYIIIRPFVKHIFIRTISNILAYFFSNNAAALHYCFVCLMYACLQINHFEIMDEK